MMWPFVFVWLTSIVFLEGICFAKLIEENEPVVQVWCSENLRNQIANKLEDLDRKIELIDLKLSTKATTPTFESKPPDIQQLIAKSVQDYQNSITLETISQNMKDMQKNQKNILIQINKLNETFSHQLALQKTQLESLEIARETSRKVYNYDETIMANTTENLLRALDTQRLERLITTTNQRIHDEIFKSKKQMAEQLNTLNSNNEKINNYIIERINSFEENQRNLLHDVRTQIIKNFNESLIQQDNLHEQALAYIGKLFEEISKCSLTNDNTNDAQESLFESCDNAMTGNSESGIYQLSLPQNGLSTFDVFCLADKVFGTGWTIIQRRQDGSIDFYRNWNSYKKGFGDIEGEYWLGLEKIYAMTSKQPHELWIKLMDYENQIRNIRYDLFEIGNENEGYYLKTVGNYTGDAGDALGSGNIRRKFTTYDVDNDVEILRNCAKVFKGAWWYDTCNRSALNGVYNGTDIGMGINWSTWHGYAYSLKYAHMAIRPK